MTQNKEKTEKLSKIRVKRHDFLVDVEQAERFKENLNRSVLDVLDVASLRVDVETRVNDKKNDNVKYTKSFRFESGFTLADLLEHCMRNIKKESGNMFRGQAFTDGETRIVNVEPIPETVSRKKEKPLSEMTLEELEARQAAIIAEIEAKKAQAKS